MAHQIGIDLAGQRRKVRRFERPFGSQHQYPFVVLQVVGEHWTAPIQVQQGTTVTAGATSVGTLPYTDSGMRLSSPCVARVQNVLAVSVSARIIPSVRR